MRRVKIIVTTMDDEPLSAATVHLSDRDIAIAFKPITTEIPRSGLEEALPIGREAGYE